ncbi:acetyl-CoA C-acyltransferase, partial [Massilia scottii]|uniref:acetyl-CoA C-acyltransferase n=1 Tax=Massilia scottii TaxID=3057166 RepID=UPI002796C045
MDQRDVVICSPVRTAIGTYGGSLKEVAAPELGVAVIGEVLRRCALPPGAVQAVVMGNVIQAGLKMNPARQAAVGAGVPVNVPAMTVNRVCGSGVQALVSGALEIRAGQLDCVLAGGMENMDRAPYLFPQGRWGVRLGDAAMFDSMLHDGLNDAFSGKHSGWHTEDLATQCKVSRADQDRWALRSQQRFSAAQAAGKFDDEIVPIELPQRKGEAVAFKQDEHNRPDTTAASLARLRPAFRPDGTITAGNAPGLNSGAAAMVLAERRWADQHRLVPLARLVAYGIAAVEPGMFGLGPVPAVR